MAAKRDYYETLGVNKSADIIKVVLGYILVKKGVWITNLVV